MAQAETDGTTSEVRVPVLDLGKANEVLEALVAVTELGRELNRSIQDALAAALDSIPDDAAESAVWVHCTPLLISKGPMLCGVLPRRPCQCSDDGSHDHLVDAFWAQQNRVPPIERAGEGGS